VAEAHQGTAKEQTELVKDIVPQQITASGIQRVLLQLLLAAVPAVGVHHAGARPLRERASEGEAPVLVTSPAIRPFVRGIVERFRSQTSVLSQSEIHPRVRLKTVGRARTHRRRGRPVRTARALDCQRMSAKI
jgi:flagellar biosynthesis component FlhA